jgi:hypothetical protein
MSGTKQRIAVEKLEFPMTDSLRSKGFHLIDAGPTIQLSMSIKQPEELEAIRQASRGRPEGGAHAAFWLC